MIVDRRLSFFGMDPFSDVFERDGRILRVGIDVELSRSLLSDDGVRRLMQEGTLVDTKLIKDGLDGPLLEHRRIAPFTFPGEWSFSMLRDAALATLHVRDVLARGGFDLKDAHSYNIGFDGCRPVFIDFASIVRADPRYREWRAGAEYVDAFLRILRIWSRTSRGTALAFLNAVWARADDEALIFSGRIAHRLRSRARRAYGKALIASAMTPAARRRALEGQFAGGAKRSLARLMLAGLGAVQQVSGHPFSTAALRRRTLGISPPVSSTMWASYQENMDLHRELTPRFRRIIEIVDRLKVRDAFEVAGNQGALAEALVERGVLGAVTCSDYDEHAIDAMYLRLKSRSRTGITPLLYNVMMPDPIRCDEGRRLVGDVVIALALTHHLLLAQGYRLDAVLERIAAHGRRFMIIEYMPKGLWDGTSGPAVPDWYSREWFAAGLANFGRIVLSEQLEENRIMFLVELDGKRARSAARGTIETVPA